MDESITLVTPQMHRARGAEAFDRGLDIRDHGMNPWVPAVADWQAGYRERQAEVRRQEAHAAAEMVLALAIAMETPT
jgi:hypothetical protein